MFESLENFCKPADTLVSVMMLERDTGSRPIILGRNQYLTTCEVLQSKLSLRQGPDLRTGKRGSFQVPFRVTWL